MDIPRVLLTLLAAFSLVAGVGWTMAMRRVHEAERSRQDAAAELDRRAATIRDLGAQLQAAGRAMRRLRALETWREGVRALIGW